MVSRPFQHHSSRQTSAPPATSVIQTRPFAAPQPPQVESLPPEAAPEAPSSEVLPFASTADIPVLAPGIPPPVLSQAQGITWVGDRSPLLSERAAPETPSQSSTPVMRLQRTSDIPMGTSGRAIALTAQPLIQRVALVSAHPQPHSLLEVIQRDTLQNLIQRSQGPQPSEDIEALYQQAAVAQVELNSVAQKIASETNALEVKSPSELKGRKRALEKIETKYGGDASRLTDIARSSIIYKTYQDVQTALGVTQKNYQVISTDDRFAKPTSAGYRDVNLNLRMSNGHVVELQLHLKPIIDVKSGAGHKLYEEIRSIQANAVKENRPNTKAELEKIQELEAASRVLYDEAFEKAQG